MSTPSGRERGCQARSGPPLASVLARRGADGGDVGAGEARPDVNGGVDEPGRRLAPGRGRSAATRRSSACCCRSCWSSSSRPAPRDAGAGAPETQPDPAAPRRPPPLRPSPPTRPGPMSSAPLPVAPRTWPDSGRAAHADAHPGRRRARRPDRACDPRDPRYYADGTGSTGTRPVSGAGMARRTSPRPTGLSATTRSRVGERSIASTRPSRAARQARVDQRAGPGARLGHPDDVFRGPLAQTYLTLGDVLDDRQRGVAQVPRGRRPLPGRAPAGPRGTPTGTSCWPRPCSSTSPGRSSRAGPTGSRPTSSTSSCSPLRRSAGRASVSPTQGSRQGGRVGRCGLPGREGRGALPASTPSTRMLQLGLAADWFVLTQDDRARRLSKPPPQPGAATGPQVGLDDRHRRRNAQGHRASATASRARRFRCWPCSADAVISWMTSPRRPS